MALPQTRLVGLIKEPHEQTRKKRQERPTPSEFQQVPHSTQAIARFGLTVHLGKKEQGDRVTSKSDVMYIPATADPSATEDLTTRTMVETTQFHLFARLYLGRRSYTRLFCLRHSPLFLTEWQPWALDTTTERHSEDKNHNTFLDYEYLNDIISLDMNA
jgi:hypothetical protein